MRHAPKTKPAARRGPRPVKGHDSRAERRTYARLLRDCVQLVRDYKEFERLSGE